MHGVIIRINSDRGFAFIRDEENISRFAHARDFIPRIAFDLAREGHEVDFEPVNELPIKDGGQAKGNGMSAKEIRLCSTSPVS